MTAETTINLSKHPNIIGTKEASGNLAQCMEIQDKTPDDFILISGDDALTLPMMSFGCIGAISVIANIQPKTFGNMIRFGLEGNFEDANKLHMQMMTGYDLVGREGNPVSVKTGLEALGIMSRDVRLPLFEGSKELLRHFKMYLGDK